MFIISQPTHAQMAELHQELINLLDTAQNYGPVLCVRQERAPRELANIIGRLVSIRRQINDDLIIVVQLRGQNFGPEGLEPLNRLKVLFAEIGHKNAVKALRQIIQRALRENRLFSLRATERSGRSRVIMTQATLRRHEATLATAR